LVVTKRLEGAFGHRRVHPGAGVLDLQAHVRTRAQPRPIDPHRLVDVEDVGADGQLAALGHRLARVVHQMRSTWISRMRSARTGAPPASATDHQRRPRPTRR
jgi:hypothetical protein